jgi:AraC family transcriptional regulator
MSPSAYIMGERVNHAKELMALSELRLEDVASQSGFSSLAHMCKVFKTVVGVTPGIYRTKHIK